MNSITPNTSSELEAPAEVEASGMSRRALVRGGALAVGATWAAPAILSAVGAPLAAASVAVIDEYGLFASASFISNSVVSFNSVYMATHNDDVITIPGGSTFYFVVDYAPILLDQDDEPILDTAGNFIPDPDPPAIDFTAATVQGSYSPVVTPSRIEIVGPVQLVDFPSTEPGVSFNMLLLTFTPQSVPNYSLSIHMEVRNPAGAVIANNLIMGEVESADGILRGPNDQTRA